MKKKTISLLLTDDDPIIRAGIRAVLTKAKDIKIVGEAENVIQAQGLVAELRPMILLLDLKMPGQLSAAELEKWVRENYPDTITLVLTAHDRDAYLVKMMEAGAAGYMSKGGSAERLISAIRRAAEGEILFDSEQFARARRWRETVSEKMKSMTERELQVLKLIAQGQDNKAIAASLNITPKTAAFHVAHILEKLGLDTRQKAAAWIHAHLIDDLERLLG
ncbi:MAG TPA: response regulator transcription factor [Anaerolineales bacterium]|nr:response regulator transcription factor [Anaerolineales bacterium]